MEFLKEWSRRAAVPGGIQTRPESARKDTYAVVAAFKEREICREGLVDEPHWTEMESGERGTYQLKKTQLFLSLYSFFK